LFLVAKKLIASIINDEANSFIIGSFSPLFASVLVSQQFLRLFEDPHPENIIKIKIVIINLFFMLDFF